VLRTAVEPGSVGRLAADRLGERFPDVQVSSPRTLPELKVGQTINAAKLYQVYTDFWLEREVAKGRTLIAPTTAAACSGLQA
jgi:hypothetical protein